MRLFRFWTREDCVEAIRSIEEGISSGAQTISYTGGGTVSYTTLDNAFKLLEWLYGRVDQLDGVKPKGSVKFIQFISKRGW